MVLESRFSARTACLFTSFFLIPLLSGTIKCDVIYESASIGPTGQESSGVLLQGNQWAGCRFLISKPTLITGVGGHLTTLRGSLFAAIINLPSISSLPTFNPQDLQVNSIAGTRFSSGAPSSDYILPLTIQLLPGPYALIFGGGEGDLLIDPAPFGATGAGRMPFDNIAIGNPSFFFASMAGTWENQTDTMDVYRFVVIGVPHYAYETKSISGQAFALNNHGDVTGISKIVCPPDYPEFKEFCPYVWNDQGGPRLTSSYCTGSSCCPGNINFDINDLGQIVGGSYCLSADRAHFSDPTLGLIDMTSLPMYSEVHSINNSSQVVGVAGNRAFRWTIDQFTDLGTLGGPFSSANCINELGIVVGRASMPNGITHACMWKPDDSIQDLSTPENIAASEATSVNSIGQIVGFFSFASSNTIPTHAFIWESGIGMVDIGTLGGASSWAYSINDSGVVVGSSLDPSGRRRAFLWTKAMGMADLNDLIDTRLELNLIAARDINDTGQIATNESERGSVFDSPVGSGFLLTIFKDYCPDDPDKSAPGFCGCGVPETDTDGDLTPDCIDDCPQDPLKTAPGICGCGIPDTDTDGDGVPDCKDDCPLNPLKTAPGLCGCGKADFDSDLDGIPDCTDNCPFLPNVDQVDENGDGIGDLCQTKFVRGDANGDGNINIGDPIKILFYLFDISTMPCHQSSDVNDDDVDDLSDAIFLMNYLFLDRQGPEQPFPACGLSATIANLPCVAFIPCN
jgi:probable HAF family extracellular repeat protein